VRQEDFIVEFSELDGGILRTRVRGLRDIETTRGYWETIIARVADKRMARLLVVDELLGEEMSASEWKTLVHRVAGRGLEGIPIAHVKPFALDQIDYCEKYANESGLDARAFRDETEALHWLQCAG